MNTNNDPEKLFCLIDELQTARKLIVAGFGNLQEINMANDFYHLPHQLLASGLERLMKCYICLVHEARNGNFPDSKFLIDLGHDLQNLKQNILRDYYSTRDIPALRDDLGFLKNDDLLDKIIHVLSEFGKKARYYNLDVVTGRETLPINPGEEWGKLEREIEDITPYLSTESTERLFAEYHPKVNARIIAKLERMVRVIARQFTLGNHGGRLQQLSVEFTPFRNLHDQDFGTVDYRQSVKREQKKKDTWNKRTTKKILDGPWPTKVIVKNEFDGDWPFRFDEVVVECRERFFCVINIEGYDFALNGAAASHLGYPFPHDAGVAILGKSIGPFIDTALSLSNASDAGGATK